MTVKRESGASKACADLDVAERIAGLEAALEVEQAYWQTRFHLARTRTEEVMAEYHLDLIAVALAVREA